MENSDKGSTGAEISSMCVDDAEDSVPLCEPAIDCTYTDNILTASCDTNDDEVQLHDQSVDETTNTPTCKFGENIDDDIAVAVLKAFKIIDEMGGSQKNLLQVLDFARECYCKGDHKMSEQWPKSWSSCMSTLKNAGYKEPKTYFICLNQCHVNQWSITDNSKQPCRFCSEIPSIQFHYLSLADKIQRWCSSELFCTKMTAHWDERESWLYMSRGSQNRVYKEIWDGNRFCELSWFWNPEAQWLLPSRCSVCKEVISAKIISEAIDVDKESFSVVGNVKVKCSNCSTRFCLYPKYARGDPRNLALIGHWDGWQPFSTSIKHSCGMYNVNYMHYVPICQIYCSPNICIPHVWYIYIYIYAFRFH